MSDKEYSSPPAIHVQGNGKVVVLVVEGELFLGNIKGLETVWDEQIAKKPEVLALNCAGVTFMDSSAIGSLVKFHNHAGRIGTQLVCIDLTASLMKIFIAAKLDRIFTIVSEQEFKEKYPS